MKEENSSALLCFTTLSLPLAEHLKRSILCAQESLCYCVTVSTYGWLEHHRNQGKSSLNEYYIQLL